MSTHIFLIPRRQNTSWLIRRLYLQSFIFIILRRVIKLQHFLIFISFIISKIRINWLNLILLSVLFFNFRQFFLSNTLHWYIRSIVNGIIILMITLCHLFIILVVFEFYFVFYFILFWILKMKILRMRYLIILDECLSWQLVVLEECLCWQLVLLS